MQMTKQKSLLILNFVTLIIYAVKIPSERRWNSENPEYYIPFTIFEKDLILPKFREHDQ